MNTDWPHCGRTSPPAGCSSRWSWSRRCSGIAWRPAPPSGRQKRRRLDLQAGKQVISCSSETWTMLTEQRRSVSSLRHEAQLLNRTDLRADQRSRPESSPHVTVFLTKLLALTDRWSKEVAYVCPYRDPVGTTTHTPPPLHSWLDRKLFSQKLPWQLSVRNCLG